MDSLRVHTHSGYLFSYTDVDRRFYENSRRLEYVAILITRIINK